MASTSVRSARTPFVSTLMRPSRIAMQSRSPRPAMLATLSKPWPAALFLIWRK
jgi:hypothetical protein